MIVIHRLINYLPFYRFFCHYPAPLVAQYQQKNAKFVTGIVSALRHFSLRTPADKR